MNRAIFDTSPLCYLVLIDEVSIAPRLFESILIPSAVEQELSHSGAPKSVRNCITAPPTWLQVQDSRAKRPFPEALSLDAGEREAIWLAQELPSDWLVIDEQAARRVARDLGLKVTGLVGLLAKAQQLGLLDLPAAVRRLRETSFHIAPKILRDLLERA